MCSGKPSGVLRDKNSNIARSIKDRNGVLLSNENMLGRWREYLEDLLNLVTFAPLRSQEMHLGEENTIAAAKGCDDIQLEMLSL